MIRQEITEDSFNKKLSSSYELSILSGMDSFTYIINDAQKNILALRDYAFSTQALSPRQWKEEVQSIFAEDKLLGLHYFRTKLGLFHHKSTLIPNRLFNPAEQQTYLEHLTDNQPGSTINIDHLDKLPAKHLYYVEGTQKDFFHLLLPNAKVFHASSAIFQALKSTSNLYSSICLFAYIRSGELQILLFKDQDLQFFNTFQYQSAKDFIYFILLVFDQFKLSPESTPIHLLGQLIKDSEVYRLLKQYVHYIDFVEPPSGIQLGPKLRRLPGYFYFDLFSVLKEKV